MRPVIIDTVVIYALADRADQAHGKATALVEKLRRANPPFIILLPTLYEAHRLILYRLGIGAGQSFLANYANAYNLYAPTVEQLERARGIIERFDDQKLTLTDATNAVVALDLASPVVTFDHHYHLMGAEVIP